MFENIIFGSLLLAQGTFSYCTDKSIKVESDCQGEYIDYSNGPQTKSLVDGEVCFFPMYSFPNLFFQRISSTVKKSSYFLLDSSKSHE